MKTTLMKILALPALCIFASAAAQADVIVLNGALDAAQVVDGGGSTSTGTGFATLTIDTTLQTLVLDFSWAGLTGVADRSHLHDAPEGVSRLDPPNNRFFDEVITDPIRTIPCDWSGFSGCVPATGSLHYEEDLTGVFGGLGCDPLLEVCSMDQFRDMAIADGFYLDIHTEIYPAGELRGQLLVPTPEPAAVWLMLTFLGLLVGQHCIRLRRRPQPARAASLQS